MRKFIVLCLFLFPILANAQYFGRNKPRYKSFDFKVKETPHYDLYYYTKNKEAVDWFAQDAELWYDFFSDILFYEIPFKNPILMYENHADFQQTNATGGLVSVGTGGFTDFLKTRVVMPMTFTNQQTHQVLGHELVHAFQINMVARGENTSLKNMGNLPLWIVEGMAEYLSIGRVDPFTAMWMRRAILKDDVPTFKEMANSGKYFPYRYGQTAWSFLAGKYGDQMMRPIFQATAIQGFEFAVDTLLNTDMETLSAEWDTTLREHFNPYMRDGNESEFGKTILSKENSGSLNVSPSISPNGKYVVFLSEKDLFSTDLFLAEARTGRIVRKLSSLVKDGDLDAYNYLESSGTWSPDSKKFAFVAFSKGVNQLVIKDVSNGKTIEQIEIKKVPAFSTPVWSPDGKEIVISGLAEGQTDLYAYNLKRGKVRQLTNDTYSEIQPDFNSDGSQLVFSYDKRSVDEGRINGRWSFDLAVMDYESGAIEILDIFHTADNISANYDHDDNIYFMSDRDGYRNLYKYDVAADVVYHMTDYISGLSGISRYSPMISASSKVDRVLFSYYAPEGYDIISAKSDQLLNKVVAKDDIDFSAAMLPNPASGGKEIVTEFHDDIDDIEFVSADTFRNKKYDAQFKLDYVGGGGGIGVSNGLYNNQVGLQGGIDLLFGDVLGNQQVFSQLAVNGEVFDMGGQVNYINKTNPIAWGFGISHIPQRTGYRSLYRGAILDNEGEVILDNNNMPIPAVVDELNLIRIFYKSIGGFAQYPFSTKLRLEAGANIGHQGFRWDVTRNYFDQNGFVIPASNGQAYQTRQKLDVGDRIQFNEFYSIEKGLTGGANIALVGDNSSFGLTAPLTGQRFRLSAEYSYGVNNYYGLLADYRKYHRVSKVTFAWRALGYLRYENNVSSVYPLFVGNMGFVRGYDFAFSNAFSSILDDTNIGQLLGSKIGLTSFEVRIPFTGPKQLALIGTNILFTDLNFFFDMGVAFDEFSHFSDGEPITIDNGFGEVTTQFLKPAIAQSAGVSIRVNLFGAMILEPYWAHPLRKGGSFSFGMNLIPGW